jgi:hypothetical protein
VIKSLNKRSINIIRVNPGTAVGEVFNYLEMNHKRWWIAIYDVYVDVNTIVVEDELSPEEEMLLKFNNQYQSNFKL